MAEEKFSPEQSLQLIQSMISKTKQNMSDNSIYFLIWGWLTFIAFIGQFILKHILEYEKHYMVWLVVILGIILSVFQGRKEKKKMRAKTWVGENMSHLWAGMGISFFVLSMIISRMGWGTMVYPFFIMLYGLGTFVSGNFLQFRPLIIGGIIAWILAVASTWVSYDYQMLFAAAAILFSYIIPAYMLRRRDKIINQ
jgi:MFS family permease